MLYKALIIYHQRDKDPATRVLKEENYDGRIYMVKGVCVRL